MKDILYHKGWLLYKQNIRNGVSNYTAITRGFDLLNYFISYLVTNKTNKFNTNAIEQLVYLSSFMVSILLKCNF